MAEGLEQLCGVMLQQEFPTYPEEVLFILYLVDCYEVTHPKGKIIWVVKNMEQFSPLPK